MAKYEETAEAIIKEAIKSAIFIDDQAKEPYSNDNPHEAERTEGLYNSFRKDGISLSVYQYNQEKFSEEDKRYILSNRDLVLLDWKLEGDGSSGEKSLEILSEIVNKQRHIHFCVIYTDAEVDNVFENVLAYFSYTKKQDLKQLEEELENEDEIKELLHPLNDVSIYMFDPKQRAEKYKTLYSEQDKTTVEEIINKVTSDAIGKDDDTPWALMKCFLAFNDKKLILSDTKQPVPSSIDTSTKTLCINNTIITIVNKNVVKPIELFDKFRKIIIKYKNGVMQLIGLEMRNIIRINESFISKDVLQVTRDALGYHKQTNADSFDSFLKSVMIEQLTTNLRNVKLSLLDAIDLQSYNEELNEEYFAMNVFYNSVSIDGDKPLSFGDVFRCEEIGEQKDVYFICITALCDCAHPKDNCFYFARGEMKQDTKKAMKIGDRGFISFLDTKKYVLWDQSSSTKHLPTYIIPEPFIVPDNMIKGGKIIVRKLSIGDNQENKIDDYSFHYVTTIKQNYAQRIANHAFMYPVRVGIDFVKK